MRLTNDSVSRSCSTFSIRARAMRDEVDDGAVQRAVVVGDRRDALVELPERVHQLAVAGHEGARRNEPGDVLEAKAVLGAANPRQQQAPRRFVGRRVERNAAANPLGGLELRIDRVVDPGVRLLVVRPRHHVDADVEHALELPLRKRGGQPVRRVDCR